MGARLGQTFLSSCLFPAFLRGIADRRTMSGARVSRQSSKEACRVRETSSDGAGCPAPRGPLCLCGEKAQNLKLY